jgi:hypothetical protein
MGSALYCKVCGGSLRYTGRRCANGCCRACHLRYCSPSDHTLDLGKARAQQAADLLASLASRPQPLQAEPER